MSLHRFKAAYNLADVPLRPFNVIIGRNASGKSTLLEALQWLDTAVRQTTNVACDRYNGISDLINHRFSTTRDFAVVLRLESEGGSFARYTCRIAAADAQATVAEEELRIGASHQKTGKRVLNTNEVGVRIVGSSRIVADDRLALSRIDELVANTSLPITGEDIADFWKNSVFLRLEPTDRTQNPPLRRGSLDPLLDEIGAKLIPLIEELDGDGRQDLADMLHSVLPDIQGVEVFMRGPRPSHYALHEDIVYRGIKGSKVFPIPSWMLSEGTRRMTAIFALLAHRPGPSLLCIEEVENGLDPISVRKVLGHLKEASLRGVQVIVTTHSPWLLDDVDLEDVLVVRRRRGETTYTRLQDDPVSQRSDPRVRPGGRYIDLLEDEV